jgi:hypothetical protein
MRSVRSTCVARTRAKLLHLRPYEWPFVMMPLGHFRVLLSVSEAGYS